MIHDILLSLLTPNVTKAPLYEFLDSEVSNIFLHPAEHKILENIAKIVNQHADIRKFILHYSSQLRPNLQVAESDVDIPEDSLQKGLYLQAFADGIDLVLEPYRKSIVDLEQRYLMKPNYSLLFVYQQVDSFQPLFAFLLRFIAGIKTQKLHGCAILQYLYQHILHGNTKIMEAIRIIQKSVHLVFLKQLFQWIIYGNFVDIYGEYFIQHIENKNTTSNTDKTTTNTTTSDATSSNTDLWRYEICYDMLPQYFTASWAEKVLFIGQTVVMFNTDPRETMRKANIWNHDEVDSGQKGSLWNDKEYIYFNKMQELYTDSSLNISKFEQIIDDIKNYVSERLSEIAINQADLIKQLKLIKDLYLLGRGELFLEFIKQTSSLSSHNMNETIARDVTKAFQTAINRINITDDLEQFTLKVPMDEFDTSSYENCEYIQFIMLKYKVKWPLHLLFSPKVIERYNDMFRFLLKIKKIQYDLHMVWCHHREKKMKKNSALLQFRNILMFFVDNLQYYLQVDVLEGQFCILMNTVQSSKDFEQIQRAHTVFQANILSFCFLLSNDGSFKKTGIMYSIEHPVLTILLKIMQNITVFCIFSLCCCDPMTSEEEQLFENCEHLFHNNINDLMKLLIGLESGSSSAPLAQLLLRLDYNYWFSSRQTKSLVDQE